MLLELGEIALGRDPEIHITTAYVGIPRVIYISHARRADLGTVAANPWGAETGENFDFFY